MGFKINESVTWLGKIDWEVRKFHGEEYSTHRGSSYNAYLEQNRKIALIDTVRSPFGDEFAENLKKKSTCSRLTMSLQTTQSPITAAHLLP
jgi:flavorubredoxin